MKILFITAHPYLPQMYGGLQTSTDQLCRGLIERGHEVAVLSGLIGKGWFGLKTRLKLLLNRWRQGRKIARDYGLGYPTWRSWFSGDVILYVIEREKPDVIAVTTGQIVPIVAALKAGNIPILVQLHDVELHLHGGAFEELDGATFIANSRFTAARYAAAYGIAAKIIYPFLCPEHYRTISTRQNVTLINPHPQKGVHLALEIARRCPEIPFCFVESWVLSPAQRRDLLAGLAGLSNITLHPPQQDMRRVYARCKILLVPSLWEEAYGRVATEAQLSGIPVIASTRGGLPEAVGAGGILIDPDGPLEPWVEAVRRLWTDNTWYGELAAAAAAHAARPELDHAHQLGLYEEAFTLATGVAR